MANSRLLKEAIADAKAVKETALANAKIALEEAFTPRLQSILSQKLREDATEEDGEDSYGATNEDLDSSDIGAGTEVKPKDPSGFEAHTDLKGDKFMDSVSSAGGAIGSELDDYEKVADINERRYRRRMEEDGEDTVAERRRFRKENEDGEDGTVSERRFRRDGENEDGETPVSERRYRREGEPAAEDGEPQPTVAELRARMMRRLRRDNAPVAGETYEDGEEIPVSEYRKFRRDMEEDGEDTVAERRRFRREGENEDGETTNELRYRRSRRDGENEDGETTNELRRFRREGENEEGETINERRRYRREGDAASEEELDLNHIIRELENAIAGEEGEPTAMEDDNAQAIAERRWYRRYRRDAETGLPTAEEDPMQEDDINMIPGVPSGVPASEDGTEEDAFDMSGTIAEGRGYRKGRKAKRKAYRKRKYKKNAPLSAEDAAEDELMKEDNAVLAERYRRLLRRYRRNGVAPASEEELNKQTDATLAERYRRLRRDGALPPSEEPVGEEEDQVQAERYRRLKERKELPASEDNVPTEDDGLVAERYRRLRRNGLLPESEEAFTEEDDEVLSERYRKLRRDGELPEEEDLASETEENDAVQAEMYRRLLRRKKRDMTGEDEHDAVATVAERRRSRRDDSLAPVAPAAEEDTIEIADDEEVPLNERRYRRREEAPAAPAAEDDDVVDLEEILRQLREEEGAPATAAETDEDDNAMSPAAINENRRAKRQLREAYTTINSLRKTINEVNLLNAKLLFANKLFRTFNMTNEQKVKVIETLDRTKSVREIKLVYSTLAENLRTVGGKLAKRTIAEGVASRVVNSTKPASSKGVISEGTNFANRFKKLAGIIK